MSIFDRTVEQVFHKELRQMFVVRGKKKGKKKDALSKNYVYREHPLVFDLTKSALLKDR